MKTYLYTVTNLSTARGYNRTITVYRMLRNEPIFVCHNTKTSTVAWYGDRGEAIQLISKIEGYGHDHYSFNDKSIRLFLV